MGQPDAPGPIDPTTDADRGDFYREIAWQIKANEITGRFDSGTPSGGTADQARFGKPEWPTFISRSPERLRFVSDVRDRPENGDTTREVPGSGYSYLPGRDGADYRSPQLPAGGLARFPEGNEAFPGPATTQRLKILGGTVEFPASPVDPEDRRFAEHVHAQLVGVSPKLRILSIDCNYAGYGKLSRGCRGLVNIPRVTGLMGIEKLHGFAVRLLFWQAEEVKFRASPRGQTATQRTYDAMKSPDFGYEPLDPRRWPSPPAYDPSRFNPLPEAPAVPSQSRASRVITNVTVQDVGLGYQKQVVITGRIPGGMLKHIYQVDEYAYHTVAGLLPQLQQQFLDDDPKDLEGVRLQSVRRV